MNLGAELIGQRARPFGGPVGQMHALEAALDQAKHHRARRPPGAQHQRLATALSHPGAQASRLLIKPSMSVLVESSSPSSYHSVLAAPTARARASGLRQRQRALLVRNGDVGADKAVGRQMQHELGKTFGRHRLDIVAALDPERPQPVMMDQRRARMRRRPSDQACGAGFVHGCHRPVLLQRPMARYSLKSDKPRWLSMLGSLGNEHFKIG